MRLIPRIGLEDFAETRYVLALAREFDFCEVIESGLITSHGIKLKCNSQLPCFFYHKMVWSRAVRTGTQSFYQN